ncbi:MAG: hypothetical protein QOF58_1979 [Pseudonocardiales bacterium]|nr:hypothetical protein [Pseudonocardiales bacterium]
MHHPEAGTMTLSHEALPLNQAQGQRLIVYLATAGTPDHDAMTLPDMLASPRPPRTGTTSSAESTAQATASPCSDPTTPHPDPTRSHDRPPHDR